MPDNPIVPPLLGHGFGACVAWWRLAAAIRAQTEGQPSPTVTREGARSFSPWEDVVEQWDDGRLHLWQAKAGGFSRQVMVDLIRTLAFRAGVEGTLVVQVGVVVSNVNSKLTVLRDFVNAVRDRGASFDSHDESTWARLMVEAAGDRGRAEDVARRLHLKFFDDVNAIREAVVVELRGVYESDVLPAVCDRLLNVATQALGVSLTAQQLRSHDLLQFEPSRIPELRSSTRVRYLRMLRHAFNERRVLRGIRDLVALRLVWTPLRVVAVGGLPFDGDELDRHLMAGEMHLLVAPAGSGKTELLTRTAMRLAGVADGTPSAPLPLVVRVRDLSPLATETIATSSENFAPGTAELVRPLLATDDLRWIVLVDGVDECENGVELVLALRQRFPGATFLVASRPGAVVSLETHCVFRVQRWTPVDGERFLRAMADADPAHAESVLRLGTRVARLLERPLTATLASLAAVEAGPALLNPTLLFRAAVRKLVGAWAARRAVPPRWEQLADAVRPFALEFIRGQRERVTAFEVERLLSRAAPELELPDALRHTMEIDLGVLVPVGDGYEFLFRGLAEFLAGQSLADDVGSVLDAASHGWGTEAARHALVLLSERNPTAFLEAVRQVLRRAQACEPASLGTLRTLATVAWAIADISPDADPIAEDFVAAICPVLFREDSPWFAEVMAEPLAELASRPSACWSALRAIIGPRILDRRSPVDYVRALPDGPADKWMQWILHCDAMVRSEAVRRLAPYAEDSAVMWILTMMLGDVPAPMCLDTVPAVEAGMALRRAARQGRIAEHMDLLRDMVSKNSQLMAAAAAAALRPGECDARAAALALRSGAGGFYSPAEVVKELGETNEGAEALDAVWPSWRDYAPLRGGRPKPDGREPLPPSSLTHRRLIRLLSSALAHDDKAREILVEVEGEGARDLYLQALFSSGLEQPEHIASFLRKHAPPEFPHLPPSAADALGRAGVRHHALGALLLAKWSEFLRFDHGRRMAFPGRALEPMVIAGSEEARRVYVEWLPHAPYGLGVFYGGPPPDARLFAHAEVRQAAHAIVEAAWSHATEGSTDKQGEPLRLAPGAAASVALQYSAASGHSFSVDRLAGWLTSADTGERRAALSILAWAPNVDEIALVSLLRPHLSPKTYVDDFVATRAAIEVIVERGLAATFRDELLVLVARYGPSFVDAACALVPALPPSEAVAVSQLASKGSAQRDSFERRDHETLRDLVELAPDDWAAASLRHVAEQGPVAFGLIVPVIKALPLGVRRSVLRTLRPQLEPWLLPWCIHDRRGAVDRPRDVLDQLRYGAGEP